jgi:hypothetical protein
MTTILKNRQFDSGGSLKLPGTPLPEGAGDSISVYMKQFPYKLRFKAGQTYSQDFKDIHEWCLKNLGLKYKDWFLTGNGGIRSCSYTLYLKDSKKSMFLALKYSEMIDRDDL